MKKIVLIMVAMVMSFSAVIHAQTTTQSATVDARKTKLPLVTRVAELEMAVRSQADVPVASSVKKVNAPADNATFLVGTFTAKGREYFDGNVEWEVVIRKDNTDPAKFWISNLVPDASTQEVYATLNGNNLTIPVGQIILSSGANIGTLRGYPSANANPVGVVNEAAGEISFALGYGTQASNGAWYGIMTQNSKFYNASVLPPTASYIPPTGILWHGVDEDSYSLIDGSAVASPLSTWKWTDVSTLATSYSWAYREIVGETTQPHTATTKDLTIAVTTGDYYTPTLTVTAANGKNSSFTAGAPAGATGPTGQPVVSYVSAGGGATTTSDGSVYDLGLYNVQAGIANRAYVDYYAFGTGRNGNNLGQSDALISVHNPSSTLSFTGVNIFVAPLTAPATTEFTLEVVAVTLGQGGFPEFGEVLGTATLLASEAIPYVASTETTNGNFGVLPFKDFVVMVDGFEENISLFELDSPFALVFSGYNKPGVELSVLIEDGSRPEPESYTFFKSSSAITQYPQGTILSWTAYKSPLLFTLVGGAYSYVESPISEISVPAAGGTYNVTLVPLFSSLSLDGTPPTWINVTKTDHFNQTNWGSDVRLVVSPLASGSRTADLKFKTRGASATIKVTQTAGTGVSGVKLETVSVVRRGDNFELTYPFVASLVTVYNVTGQKVGEYKLNGKGTFTLPAAGLANGVYVLKFDDSTTVKILK
jgi:hypothetical protein